jgi:HEAT repeat protein
MMAVNLSDPAQLTVTLRMLTEPDTDVIRRAEKMLNKWLKDPAAISSLINQITSCADANIRHHAALLLKKKISVLFSKLNNTMQEELKIALLNIVTNEPIKVVQTALAGAVACLSKSVMAKGAWPEMFNLLMQLAQDPREPMRSLCYNLIGQLAEHVPEHLKPHTNTLSQMFIIGCRDSASAVCVDALASTSSYITALADEPEVMLLQGVLRPMLEVMEACLKRGDEEVVAECLDVIQETCIMDQPLINEQIEFIVPFVVEIMKSTTCEDQVKQAAGQTLMNILEYRPKLIAKKNLVNPILTSLVELIAKSDPTASNLYVTASQHQHLNDDDDDESYNSAVEVQHLAQSCLDTMAINIPSKHFSQPALSIAAQCLESADPQMRKAGCAVLGVIAEGCCDIIKQSLNQILPKLLSSVQDPEYYVRESACFALGQFSEHCQPEILYFHQQILPTVFTALEDPRPAVQGTSCYVLEMFCENLEPDTLRPVLGALVNKLSQLLQSPQKNTQEMALAALAATAVASEIDFLPYTEVSSHALHTSPVPVLSSYL